MPTVRQLSDYSQVALASYAEVLVSNADNTAAYSDDAVNMSESQATSFNTTWNVLQQATNPNGFSAVLLQNRATNEKVLAIAGTDDVADLITDVIDIGLLGTVLDMPQYAALESLYQQLVSAGTLGASEQVVVTGHSVGGFLAQGFTARDSSVVFETCTYNAPGFSSIEDLLGLARAVRPPRPHPGSSTVTASPPPGVSASCSRPA